MTTRLIVNADDYGRNTDVSRGIRFAHLHGLVTSSTCMMNMPPAVEDLKLALLETPKLGLGVHLVLTAGKPINPATRASTLVDPDGFFLKQETLIRQASKLDTAIVKEEWRAQIEAFISAAGKKPTHLDSHHHSSYFTPSLIRAMLELAREYDLPIRLPLSHDQDLEEIGLPGELVANILEFAPSILEEFQPRSADAFFASFYDELATRAEFLRILNRFPLNGCFEIMCHPGFVNEAFAKESSYAFQRQVELKILTDPSLKNEIDSRGIQLISFADL